jgi:hypothetical protein
METQYTWRTRQDLDICHDCVHVSASGAPDYDGYIESGHAERYAQAVKQYGDEPCYLGAEPSFVKVPCDFCGDTFAGSRYSASVMQLHTEDR